MNFVSLQLFHCWTIWIWLASTGNLRNCDQESL
jgi:hypothetical protein